ncbi:MAG: hypothetical protein QOI24_912 [Acidobacteriota bacterium]|jgi:hypothetical protein|nr:hypothetical protein [Acidobacteriota bacterium]
MNLNELTLETAKSLEGTHFDLLTADGRTVPLTLESVLPYVVQERRRTRGAPVAKRDPFALYFLGSPDEVLPQAMYTVQSANLTLEGVFIVPVGRDDAATEYEAVFT